MTTAPVSNKTYPARPAVAPAGKLTHEQIVAKLQAVFPDVLAVKQEIGEMVVEVPAHQIRDILLFLRDTAELKFDSLMSQIGYDDGKDIMVVYPLYSMQHRHRVMLVAGRGQTQ